MRPFQKSKIVLLEELQTLVTEKLSEGNSIFTRDERRHNRKLKLIRREIDEWVKDLKVEEKLKSQASRQLEEDRKKTEEYYASDPCNRSQ